MKIVHRLLPETQSSGPCPGNKHDSMLQNMNAKYINWAPGGSFQL